MGFINTIVKHDSVDISTSTISYNRDHQICTGIGTLELIVPRNIGRTFDPWDVIEIWENGNKKGKFFVDSVSDGAKDGVIQIAATDGSKKLTDYFIVDSYTIDYLSHGRTWIEKFLTEAGVTYSFTVAGNGSPLSDNTSLGFDSAFNTITTLLQQSGWYLYFNNDGTAIIGDLHKDLNDPDHTITDADFATLERELDDDRLRNRAVVWGNSNPTYGEVFVDISVPTPWNYDANDKRAVVISNSSIYSNAQALALAQKMLNEFTQIKDEKTLLVVEDYNLQLGEILKVSSPTWDGRGLITGITAMMSEDGLVYAVNINKKCPRLFTFYSTLPPTVSGFYVYVGTLADGIWRKHTQGSSWYNDSSGLQDLEVKDLFIRNGVFASVSGDGYLYTRTSEVSPWYKYDHPSLRDREGYIYPASNLMAEACSISSSDTVIAGYNYAPITETTSGIPTSGVSWVLELTGSRDLIKAEQVVISGLDEIGASIVDVESAGEYNVVSVMTDTEVWQEGLGSLLQGNGNSPRTAQHFLNANNDSWGDKLQLLPADTQSYSWAPPTGDIKLTKNIYSDPGGDAICGLIKDRDNIFYTANESSFSVLDAETMVKRIYDIKPTEQMTRPNGNYISEINLFVRRITSQKFDVIMTGRATTPAYHYYIRHFTYTLNDTEYVYQGGYTITQGVSHGVFLLGTSLVWTILEGADGDHTSVCFKYNLITKSISRTELLRYTDAMTPHNGVKENYWRTIVCGAGDTYYVISYWAEAESWDTCIFLPPSLPTRPTNQDITFYGKYIKFTSYGSESIIGPTVIDSVSVGSLDDCSIGLWGPYIYGTDYASNPMTRHSYFRIDWYKTWSDGGTGNCSSITNSTHSEAHFSYFKVPGWVKIKHLVNPVPEPKWKDYNLDYNYLNSLHSRYGGPWGVSYDVQWDDPNDTRAFLDWSTGKESHREDLGNNGFINFKGSGQRDDIRQQPTERTYDKALLKSHWFSPRTWQVYTRMDGESAYGIIGMVGKWPVTYAYGRWYIYDAIDISQYEDGIGKILKHTSTDTISGYLASDDSSLQTQGNFEIIQSVNNPCKVDIAKGAPTVIYDIPTSGWETENFGASIQNAPGSFYTHSDPKQVYEAKVFDLPLPGTFPTASGEFNPSDYERYIGISNYEGLLASEYYLNTPWVNMVTVASGVVVSGLISHFETSNYVPEGTYFFYTVSGIVSFYQKNPDENYWVDYSAGLPSSEITNIRVDDML